MFEHKFINGEKIDFPRCKVVCAGLNYTEHIEELGHKRTKNPVFFMKPYTALCNLEDKIVIPDYGKNFEHEVEIALLIGKEIKSVSEESAESAILGYGLALDLTLRDIQKNLKNDGLPWEISKAFDKSCPVSPFVKKENITSANDISFSLSVNGIEKQIGKSGMMIWGIFELVSIMSKYFTLMPGDIVLTGTPKGIGPLKSQDKLILSLNNKYVFETSVL